MNALLIAFLLIAVVTLLVLGGWRQMDQRADRVEMNRLRALQPIAPARFSKAMVADLPEPAQRYFSYTITEGTPLLTVAEVEMGGWFALGDRDAPNDMAMDAIQVLAAPHGFVWKMSARSGVMRLSGSDSGQWTRFWLAGLLPVARFGGTADHTRSAFGRYVAEAAFWTPAALLPGQGAVWEGVSRDTARCTVTHNGFTQAVDITVDTDGCPTTVQFQRWSDANSDKIYRLQSFGGDLSNFKEIAGFRLPMHVEAGNFYGTDDYFPFFIADVSSVRFPTGEEN